MGMKFAMLLPLFLNKRMIQLKKQGFIMQIQISPQFPDREIS